VEVVVEWLGEEEFVRRGAVRESNDGPMGAWGMSFKECDWMRGEAGGRVIELRESGRDLSFGCRGRSETVIEAILDNAGISALSTGVGGVLRVLVVLACTEKAEVVDAVDGLPDCNKGWSMGEILRVGETGCFEGPLVEEVPCGGTVDKK
jgi:hypothetical protein